MSAPTVLLIDDEEALRTVLKTALEDAGFTVTPAENGSAAIAALEQGRFDLIITDVIMPGKDGIEVLSELHRIHSGIPVIVMSGGGRMPPEQYLGMAQKFGARAILEKPFRMRELVETAKRVLALKDT